MLHARTYVANSTIQNAGNGLFAEERIHRGQTVADYADAKPITYAQFRRLVEANASTHVARIRSQYYDGRGFVAGSINRPAKHSKPSQVATKADDEGTTTAPESLKQRPYQ